MAINLKEYVRESIKQYLALIKNNMYTKTEVDALVDAIIASDISLDGYTIGNALSDISPTDTVDVALGKLEYKLSQLPDMSTKADLVGGKVPVSQLPDTVTGSLEYKGTWDADTNTPDISNNPDKGDYYVVSTAGGTNLSGITDWDIGDWAIYNGTEWSKLDRSADVTAVSGDAIVAPFDDITATEANNDWNNA